MKISQDIQTFLDKNSTKNFLKVAGYFIELIEEENISTEQFYRKAHGTLIDLYSCGHKLEQIELKYSSSDSDFGVLDDEFFKNKNQVLFSTLGKDSFYCEVFDPTYTEKENGQPEQGWEITDKEPSQGWLVDDFADIYRDLKIEIEKMKIETDEAVEDALWQMKWSFINHWGQHCINALRYLHYLWYDGKISM
ncbi:MAG: DUF5063 domain-containing protein [Fluviicola sp.]|nr:DUF5063 domain-containing protein [Fluviicola sp.]